MNMTPTLLDRLRKTPKAVKYYGIIVSGAVFGSCKKYSN
jgi:hypothetical protein